MPKIKFYHGKVLFVALWIIITSTLTYAERDYMAEYDGLPDEDAKINFIKSLNEDELLVMGNQAYIKDPTGDIAKWQVGRFGLNPIWEQNPPQANKYLPLIQDETLNLMWRGYLTDMMHYFIDYWSNEDIERLITYMFEYIKNPKIEITLKRDFMHILVGLVYPKMLRVIESKEITLEEKKQQVDKIHIRASMIIKYWLELLQDGVVVKDEQLFRGTVEAFRAFGKIYLSPLKKEAPPVEYRTSQAFDTAVKAATSIGPGLVQVLQRKDSSTEIISQTIGTLIHLGLVDYIPSNLIEDLKKDIRFSNEKAQNSLLYWEQEIREAGGNSEWQAK